MSIDSNKKYSNDSEKNIIYTDIKLDIKNIIDEALLKKNFLKNLKILESIILYERLTLEELEKIYNYVNSLLKNKQFNKQQEIFLISILLIIINYLFEKGFNHKINELIKKLHFNTDKINYIFETIFKYKINKATSSEEIYFKINLLRIYQTFKFNLLNNYIDKKLPKSTIIEIIKKNLEENIIAIKQLINNVKFGNFNIDIDIYRYITTVISFSNYYFILLSSSNSNSIKENVNIKNLLDQYSISIENWINHIYNNLTHFQKFTKNLTFRTLIVSLGNFTLLTELLSPYINFKIEEITKIIKNTLSHEKFKHDILNCLKTDCIELQFLKFYSGLTFEITNDDIIYTKKFKYPSLKQLVSEKNENEIIKNLIFLKQINFRNVRLFAKALSFLKEINWILELENVVFSIEYKNYISEKLEKYKNILLKEPIGISIDTYCTILKILFNGINIKPRDITIYTSPQLIEQKQDINFLKVNIPINIQPFDNINNKYIKTIDKNFYINGESFYFIHLDNDFNIPFIIKIKLTFFDEESIENNINNYKEILIEINTIFAQKIFDFIKKIYSLDKKLQILNEKHIETIFHMETLEKIIGFIIKKLKENPKLKNYVNEILEYFQKGYLLTEEQIYKFFAFIHDIGKSETDINLYKQVNRKTHIKIFLDILKQINFKIDKKQQLNKQISYLSEKQIYDISNLIKKFIYINYGQQIRLLLEDLKVINFEIENYLQNLIFKNFISFFKTNLNHLKKFLKENGFTNIKQINILNGNKILLTTENISLKDEDASIFILTLYNFLQILIIEIIKQIQIPHVMKGLEILYKENFEDFLFTIFHHKYPNFNINTIKYLEKLINFYKKFNHTSDITNNLNLKKIKIKNFSTTTGGNLEQPWQIEEKDLFLTIISIADIISALKVENRSYINSTSNNNINYKPEFFSESFLKIIENELNKNDLSEEQIYKIIDEEFYQNPYYPFIKIILTSEKFKQFLNNLKQNFETKVKNYYIKNNIKNELIHILRPNYRIIVYPNTKYPIINETEEAIIIKTKENDLIKLNKKIVQNSKFLKIENNNIINISNYNLIINYDKITKENLILDPSLIEGIIILPENSLLIEKKFIKNLNSSAIYIKPLYNKNLNIVKLRDLKITCILTTIFNHKIILNQTFITGTNVIIENILSNSFAYINEGIKIHKLLDKNYIRTKNIETNFIENLTNDITIIVGDKISINSIKGNVLIIGEHIEINNLEENSKVLIFGKDRIEIKNNNSKITKIIKNPFTKIIFPFHNNTKIYELSQDEFNKYKENYNIKIFKELYYKYYK